MSYGLNVEMHKQVCIFIDFHRYLFKFCKNYGKIGLVRADINQFYSS